MTTFLITGQTSDFTELGAVQSMLKNWILDFSLFATFVDCNTALQSPLWVTPQSRKMKNKKLSFYMANIDISTMNNSGGNINHIDGTL